MEKLGRRYFVHFLSNRRFGTVDLHLPMQKQVLRRASERKTKMKTVSTKVSQKKLRELAERAVRVIERHTSHVSVRAAATSLVPAAEAFAKGYDEGFKFWSDQSSEMEGRRASMVALDKLLKSSLAIVQLVAPGFDTSELTATVETPDRLMVNARRVLEVLAHAGDSVPEGQALIAALKEAADKAEEHLAAAHTSRVELQQSQATVRELAIAFNRELVALRRILRATVGTHHLDFQALRASRVKSVDIEDEDDTVVEDEVEEATLPSEGVSNGASKANTPVPALASGTIA